MLKMAQETSTKQGIGIQVSQCSYQSPHLAVFIIAISPYADAYAQNNPYLKQSKANFFFSYHLPGFVTHRIIFLPSVTKLCGRIYQHTDNTLYSAQVREQSGASLPALEDLTWCLHKH